MLTSSLPAGYPVPGRTIKYDDSETVDLDNVPLEGSLVKALVLSVDPYFRGLMAEKTDVVRVLLSWGTTSASAYILSSANCIN